MADSPTASNERLNTGLFRVAVLVVLVLIWRALGAYAPLVPKVVVFLDDVHTLREKSVQLQATATDVKQMLEKLNNKFHLFEAEFREAERVRQGGRK